MVENLSNVRQEHMKNLDRISNKIQKCDVNKRVLNLLIKFLNSSDFEIDQEKIENSKYFR